MLVNNKNKKRKNDLKVNCCPKRLKQSNNLINNVSEVHISSEEDSEFEISSIEFNKSISKKS